VERKRFLLEVYAKKWPTSREKTYGFMKYDKNLCNHIYQHVPKESRLLEVAIGTGYPIADFLQKTGYIIHGVDISPLLIDECRRLNPEINCKVGDAEYLEYSDNYFDATYCFHSTWYFPNLEKAIGEMIRVTRPGGMVVFDIQNRNNSRIDQGYRRRLSRLHGIGRLIVFAAEIVQAVLQRHSVNYHFLFHPVVHEVPVYPESIYEYLKRKDISGFQVMVRKEDESLEMGCELGRFEDFDRLVFVVRK